MAATIDPEIAGFIAALNADWRAHPPLETLMLPGARAVAELVRRRWRLGGPVMAETRELTIATGAGPLQVRVHRPDGLGDGAAPALFYLHGGGFVLFSIDTHDRLMREYAAAGGFAVIGVDYPLSPEAKFPVALDRIVALLADIALHAEALGIDPGRIAIGGDSAGANLALAAAMRLRDAGRGEALRGILSNYGAFSARVSDEAEAAFGGSAAVLNRGEMDWFFAQYLADPAALADPFACPLVADDFAGLPATMLVIPEMDVLTEQSLALAKRLRAAGVPVSEQVYPGATHSFLEAMSVAAIARQAIADGAAWVANRLR